MNIYGIRNSVRAAAVCGGVVLLVAGCDRKVDNNMNFTNAINTYYSAHPACLWREPIKFPVQEDTSDTSKTSGYDALVDQGLLVRTTAEKKKMIIASKQVNNYDLSDKGRASWTADTTQPGFGNFCYGHRKVSNIDSSTPTNSETGATTQVNYHYTLTDVAGWANAAETQTAYPRLRSELAGPLAGKATLTNTTNGWQVAGSPGASNADGSIVE